MDQKDQTKERFNADAKAYEERIIKHVNGYLDMHLAVFNFIPFKPMDRFNILDLGVGSSKLDEEILSKFPNSTLTGVDFSAEMLKMSSTRLERFGNRVKLLNLDFDKELPEGKFDLVIMILALHHLEDPNKRKMIKKLYSVINAPGALLIGDLTKSQSQRITDIYMELWRENLRKNGYSEEYIAKCYHEKYETEDIPATLENHLTWLKEAQFEEIEIFWKRYHFVVFGGFKGIKK